MSLLSRSGRAATAAGAGAGAERNRSRWSLGIDWRAARWTASTLVVLLVGWALLTSVLGLIPQRVLPSPVDVGERFAELLVDPFAGATLVGHVTASLSRWISGVMIAALVGVPLGFLVAWVPLLRAIVAPVFELLRYIPPFAWIPIAVLWMGANTSAQALVVFVAAFPPIVINSRLGVTQVDPLLPNAARTLGSGSVRTLCSVVAPLAASSAFTGLRIGFGNGWMALVGAELIVGTHGLGNLILAGQTNNSTPIIVVGMVSIALIAILFDVFLQKTQRRLFVWAPQKGN